MENTAQNSGPVFIPRVDLYESPEKFTALVDLPGVDEKDLDVTVERNRLTVRGSVGANGARANARDLRTEYAEGDFERTFLLTDEIDSGRIEAALKNGVLHLQLPKADRARPRKVPIHAA